MKKTQKNLFKFGLLMLILGFVLVACSSEEPTPTPEPPPPPTIAAPENTAVPEAETPVEEVAVEESEMMGDTTVASLTANPWLLVVSGEAGNGTVVQEGTVLTAVFNADGTLVGSGGCNNFSGTYQAADDGSITVGPLASTQAFCEEGGDQEQTYFAALQGVTHFLVNEEGRLEMGYPSGSEAFSNALVYAVAETTLENTQWVLLSYGSEGEEVEVVPGTAVTANFFPEGEGASNGTLTGSATCNGYNTSYTVDGNNITVGLMASTLALCPVAQDQEDAYMAAISTAQTYEIAGSTLTIAYDGGVLTYTSANLPLENVLWTLVSVGGQPVPAELSMTALFLEGDEANSGNVGGSGSCNNFGTTYQVDGDQIIIDPFATTMIFCPEGGELEGTYFGALSTAQTYQILGDQLRIETANGDLLYVADRAPLEGTLWNLVSVGSIDTPSAPLADSNFTATFARQPTAPSGLVFGETGCNNYNATYVANLNEIKVNLPSKSLADCGDGFNEAEQQFFLGLNAATEYRILGSTLQVVYDDGNQALSFVAAPPVVDEARDLTPLNSTFWYLTSLNGADVVAGTEVTAQFSINEDGVTGVISGSGGCNGYNATIGENFVVAPFATTQIACSVPPGIDAQEQAYFAALQASFDYSIAGDQLLLANADGILTFNSNQPENSIDQTIELQNKTWTLISYGALAPVSGAEPTAFFGTDGSVAGKTGCNDYNGAYSTQPGNNLAISGITSTKAACATDELSKQESDFTIFMQSAVRYLIIDTQLQIQTVDGTIMNFSSLPNQTIPAAPTAIINGPTSGDVGQSLSFDGSASTPGSNPIVRYDWDMGDGTVTSGSSIAHAYNAAGTYTVQMTAVDAAGQTGTSSISVVINTIQQTPPNATVTGPTAVAAGAPVTFDASASAAGSSPIQSYTFSFGNGQTAGPGPDAVGTTAYTQAGTYNVTVTVTDQNGLSDSASMQVVVNPGLQGTSWLYTSPVASINPISINLNFGAASLSGFAGCNSYSAPYTANVDGNIRIEAITIGQAVCSEDIMAQENAYIQLLPAAISYALNGSQLTLNLLDGGVLNYNALSPTPY